MRSSIHLAGACIVRPPLPRIPDPRLPAQQTAEMLNRNTSSQKQRLFWLGIGLLIGLTSLGIRNLLGDSQNVLGATITVLIPVIAALFASFHVRKSDQ
ncbi:hypothetical protein PJL15_03392 [Paenarthrobacter nitroguajacolicus]|nr:hypothetical protein [Paenarthrobacter nitroguajacolicus]